MIMDMLHLDMPKKQVMKQPRRLLTQLMLPNKLDMKLLSLPSKLDMKLLMLPNKLGMRLPMQLPMQLQVALKLWEMQLVL